MLVALMIAIADGLSPLDLMARQWRRQVEGGGAHCSKSGERKSHVMPKR